MVTIAVNLALIEMNIEITKEIQTVNNWTQIDNVTTLQECDCGAADLVDPGHAMEEIRSALKDIEMIGPGRLPSSLDLSPTTASFVRRSSAASDTNHIYATVSHTIRKPRMTTAVSGAPPAKPAKH